MTEIDKENGEQDSLKGSPIEEPNYEEILSESTEDVETDVADVTESAPEDTTPPQETEAVAAPETTETVEEETEEEEPTAIPPADPVSPEAQQAEYLKQLEDVTKLLEGKYTFTPEQAAAIDEIGAKPSEYLPKILAKLHQEAYFNSVEAVMRALPQTVPQITGQLLAAQKAEEQFFAAWPTLREHQDIALKAVQVAKQMNPNASMKSLIQKGGQLAMLELGQTVSSQEVRETKAATTAPFTPAAPGGGSGAPLTQAAKSYEQKVFEEMIADE